MKQSTCACRPVLIHQIDVFVPADSQQSNGVCSSEVGQRIVGLLGIEHILQNGHLKVIANSQQTRMMLV